MAFRTSQLVYRIQKLKTADFFAFSSNTIAKIAEKYCKVRFMPQFHLLAHLYKCPAKV